MKKPNNNETTVSNIKLKKIALREEIDFHAMHNLNNFKEAVENRKIYSDLLRETSINIDKFLNNFIDSYKFSRKTIEQFIAEKDLPEFFANSQNPTIKTWKEFFYYHIDKYDDDKYKGSWFTHSNYNLLAKDANKKQFFVDFVNKRIVLLLPELEEFVRFDENLNQIIIEYYYYQVVEDYSLGWSIDKHYKTVKHNIATIKFDIATNSIIKNIKNTNSK